MRSLVLIFTICAALLSSACSALYISPLSGETTNYSRAEAAKEEQESADAYGRSAELSAKMGYMDDAKWQRAEQSRLQKQSEDDFINGLFEIKVKDKRPKK